MEKMILLDEITREAFGKNSRLFMEKNFDEKNVIAIYQTKIKQVIDGK